MLPLESLQSAKLPLLKDHRIHGCRASEASATFKFVEGCRKRIAAIYQPVLAEICRSNP